MRDYVYDLLANPARPLSDELHALVPVARIVSSGAADELPKPFMVIRAGIETRPMGGVWQLPFTIHMHDDPGSYVLIDSVLAIVHNKIITAAPAAWNGSWVMAVRDDGVSEDLYDDHYGTATRNASYTMTARR
jgi:hypothetical protein